MRGTASGTDHLRGASGSRHFGGHSHARLARSRATVQPAAAGGAFGGRQPDGTADAARMGGVDVRTGGEIRTLGTAAKVLTRSAAESCGGRRFGSEDQTSLD